MGNCGRCFMAERSPIVTAFGPGFGDKIILHQSKKCALHEIFAPSTSKPYVGLYFSAHWCPPCRQFTPMLVDAYKKHLKAKNLEVIFVSADKSPQEFAEYYGTMPWLAIPQGDK